MKLFLVLKYYIMKTYRGGEVKLHIFMTLALDEDEWAANLA
jgi:hypothetical protein